MHLLSFQKQKHCISVQLHSFPKGRNSQSSFSSCNTIELPGAAPWVFINLGLTPPVTRLEPCKALDVMPCGGSEWGSATSPWTRFWMPTFTFSLLMSLPHFHFNFSSPSPITCSRTLVECVTQLTHKSIGSMRLPMDSHITSKFHFSASLLLISFLPLHSLYSFTYGYYSQTMAKHMNLIYTIPFTTDHLDISPPRNHMFPPPNC